ncbi:GDP-mannose 4,6-dehydratase [Lentzea rhizosphaerae]|uniref:GDP-mannose 4,6-dehydratase n=1 Tax=Lentzea rhizosphaerae TaxID=2041025 RepID=A0ABV8BQQ9_9PSEU
MGAEVEGRASTRSRAWSSTSSACHDRGSRSRRPGHDRRYLLDSARIGRELGWRPEIGFEAGVRDTIRWYAANRAWWEPLRALSPIDESAWATATR